MSQTPWTPPHPHGPYRPPLPTSTNAVVALCLGIASFALCCAPLTAVPAIVLGRRTVREIDAEPGSFQGRGLATAGWVLGVLALVAFLVAVAAVLALYFALDCSIIGNGAFTTSACV